MSILQTLAVKRTAFQSPTIDPNYADVVMYLKIYEPTEVISDISSYRHGLSARRGLPTITTGSDPFGGTSKFMSFLNDSVDFPTSTALTGFNSYTIEFWAKCSPTQTTYSTICDASTGNQTLWIGLGINGAGAIAGRMNWRLSSVSVNPIMLNSANNVIDDVWRHFAVCKDGSNAYLFVNGILEDSTSSAGIYTNEYLSGGLLGGSRYGSGTNTDNYFRGSILDFRVTKGVARYTSNFTPPTSLQPPNYSTIINLTANDTPTNYTLTFDNGDEVVYPMYANDTPTNYTLTFDNGDEAVYPMYANTAPSTTYSLSISDS